MLNEYASSPYFISPTRNKTNDELRRLTASTFNESWFGETRIKSEPSVECSSTMSQYFSNDDVNYTNSVLNYDQKWDRFPSKVDICGRYGTNVWDRITDSYHQLLRFITEIKQEFEKPFETKDSEQLSGYWDTVDAIVIMQSKDAENWKEPVIPSPVQNGRGGSWHTNPTLQNRPAQPPTGVQPGVKPIIHQIQQRFNVGGNMTGRMANENMNYNYKKSIEEARTARNPNYPRNVPNFVRARRQSTTVSHKCLHCEKTFLEMAHLRIHLRMHSGINPYKCQMCDFKSFNKATVMSNHFQNVHGRYGTNIDVCTDLQALARLEQRIAAESEQILQNVRREQQGEQFLNQVAPRPAFTGHQPSQYSQMIPTKDEKMEMEREAEEEAYTSPYFQNKFNELFNDATDNGNNASNNTGSFGTDINRNNINRYGIAAKISSITGTEALNLTGVNTADTEKRLADEMSFLY